MIRQDYILRQVRQLTEALTRVIFLRRSGRVDEALLEVESSGRLVGAGSGTYLTQLEPDAIIGLATAGDHLHVASALSLFDLLVQATELYGIEQRYDEREASAVRAINLGLAIEAEEGRSARLDFGTGLDEMIRICRPDVFTADMLLDLMASYERRGHYGRAEDMLFLLVRVDPNEAIRAGFPFFERLERLTPTRLRKGNLSLKEVREGREHLRKAVSDGPV